MLKKTTAIAALAFVCLVGMTAAQAKACFVANSGCIVFEICSYHNDGTGGYYVAGEYSDCGD